MSKKKAITFACVRFKDQASSEYDIVPIKSIKERKGKVFKDFSPTHVDDFIKTTFYHVRRVNFDSKTENQDHRYYKAHVLYLGESESDMKKKITTKRIRFPNKKYCHLSSSTDIDCSGTASQQQAKMIQKELTNRVDNRKRQKAEEELVTFYGRKQLESRANIVDSESDNDDPEQTKPDLKQQACMKKTKAGRPCTLPRIQKITEQHNYDEEHPGQFDDDSIPLEVGIRKRINRNESQDGASTSITINADEVQLDSHETRRTGSHDRPLTTSSCQIERQNQDLPTSVGGDEELLNNNSVPRAARYRRAHGVVQVGSSQEECYARNIHAPDLAHLTNAPPPDRLKKRQAFNAGIVTECHGLRRFDVVNGKIYLGLDVFIGKRTWFNTMGQKPQTYIRDVATIIWGEEAILNRCFDTKKVSVSFRGRSPRNEFEAYKLQLLRDLLDHYLEHHQFSTLRGEKIKQSINITLGRFVQDMRKPYKHLVRKQLFLD